MDRSDTAKRRDRFRVGTAVGIVVAVVVLTGGLAGVTAGQGTVSVEIQPAESDVAVDRTTTLEVVVLDAGKGVSAYDMNVTLSGESAGFTEVHPTGNPLVPGTAISEDGTEAGLAVAMGGSSHAGASEIVIAELDIEGRAPGEVAVEISDGAQVADAETTSMYTVGERRGGTLTIGETGGDDDGTGDGGADDDGTGDGGADDGGDGDGGADDDGTGDSGADDGQDGDDGSGDGSGPGFGVVAGLGGLVASMLALRLHGRE